MLHSLTTADLGFEHEKVARRFWEVVPGSRHIRSGLPP